MENKHTNPPWEARDIPGAGIQIWAPIPLAKQIQPIYNVNITPSVMVGKDGVLYAMLSYEDWRQFPSPNWEEMQRANAVLMAAAPKLLRVCKRALAYCYGSTNDNPEKELEKVIAEAEQEMKHGKE